MQQQELYQAEFVQDLPYHSGRQCKKVRDCQLVPTKQDVPVIVGEGTLDFEAYRSKGQQADEELLPEDANTGAASTAFAPNETALSMLEAMGFPRVRCEKALHATGNQDAETASLWLFEHMEDPDIDTPLDLSGGSGGSAPAGADPEKIESLGNMGFSAPQARQALKETGGDMERAVDWLFSHPDATGDFGEESATTEAEPAPEKTLVEDNAPANFKLSSIVCHKGGSIHAGYV